MAQSLVAFSAFGLYRLASLLATPLVALLLRLRLARGREEASRLSERMGHSQRPRPQGSLLWLHAASVGEAISALALIERLQVERPALAILMTSGTVTSARLMAERLPQSVIHQFVPVDLPGAVTRFLDHWQPDLAGFIESELWPNLLRETRRRGTETLLLNARLSARSARGWRLLRPMIAELLGGFNLALAQSPQDAARLTRLGAQDVQYLGNLKSAAPPPEANTQHLAALSARLESRACWLAASTHPGEELIAREAHQIVRKTHPEALTVIVPRHPHRGREIAKGLTAAGHTVGLLSRQDLPEPEQEFFIADSLGDLGLWYRLVPIVFVGGSLVPIGGHNLLEAAKLSCVVLSGPHTENFAVIVGEMKAQGAMIEVVSHVDLGREVARLLSDEAARQDLGAKALAYAEAEAGVLQRVLVALAPHLEPLAPRVDAQEN